MAPPAATHVASSRVALRQPPEAVWKTISDAEAFPTWRKEVRRMERNGGKEWTRGWVEHTRHGRLPVDVVEWDAPRRLVLKISDPSLPFGGTWTQEIAPGAGGCTVTVTERGEIRNALFRFLARFVLGYHMTLDGYLRALGKRFGERVTPEHVEAPAGARR